MKDINPRLLLVTTRTRVSRGDRKAFSLLIHVHTETIKPVLRGTKKKKISDMGN